jgi:hypothetical protein
MLVWLPVWVVAGFSRPGSRAGARHRYREKFVNKNNFPERKQVPECWKSVARVARAEAI